MRKWIVWNLLFLIMIGGVVNGAGEKIICYGKDLTSEQKVIVFREFPLPSATKAEEIKTIEVSNEEEYQLLKGLIADAEIGTKAISSVYIEKLSGNEGIKVDVRNITLITPQMFANVLATAGIKDAKVVAYAPQLVSGTAALTGIYKSFEDLAGKPLSLEAKRTAALELVQTGDLGEKFGKERSAVLVERMKERVIQEKTVDQAKILKIVDQSARDQNLKLSDTEKQELANLLTKIKALNLNLDEVKAQLKNYHPTRNDQPDVEQAEEPESWIARIFAFLRNLVNQLFSFVGRIFGPRTSNWDKPGKMVAFQYLIGYNNINIKTLMGIGLIRPY